MKYIIGALNSELLLAFSEWYRGEVLGVLDKYYRTRMVWWRRLWEDS